MKIVEVAATDTHRLRRAVLRTGTPSTEVVWDGDELPTTFHLGVRDGDGTLIAVSTWLERRHPDLAERTGYQLRGMATAPAGRGRGLATALLDAGIEECRRRGAAVVWARARTTALDFYVRRGFETRGPEYVDLATGLPHTDIVRTLGSSIRSARRPGSTGQPLESEQLRRGETVDPGTAHHPGEAGRRWQGESRVG